MAVPVGRSETIAGALNGDVAGAPAARTGGRGGDDRAPPANVLREPLDRRRAALGGPFLAARGAPTASPRSLSGRTVAGFRGATRLVDLRHDWERGGRVYVANRVTETNGGDSSLVYPASPTRYEEY
jgi:hypothetical protein